MSTAFLETLIGPFPFNEPPVRTGWYVVDTGTGETIYYDTNKGAWFEDDDGLSDPIEVDVLPKHRGWWGQLPPPEEVDDGLGL